MCHPVVNTQVVSWCHTFSGPLVATDVPLGSFAFEVTGKCTAMCPLIGPYGAQIKYGTPIDQTRLGPWRPSSRIVCMGWMDVSTSVCRCSVSVRSSGGSGGSGGWKRHGKSGPSHHRQDWRMTLHPSKAPAGCSLVQGPNLKGIPSRHAFTGQAHDVFSLHILCLRTLSTLRHCAHARKAFGCPTPHARCIPRTLLNAHDARDAHDTHDAYDAHRAPQTQPPWRAFFAVSRPAWQMTCRPASSPSSLRPTTARATVSTRKSGAPRCHPSFPCSQSQG